MIVCENVNKQYGKQVVLSDFSCRFGPGSCPGTGRFSLLGKDAGEKRAANCAGTGTGRNSKGGAQ